MDWNWFYSVQEFLLSPLLFFFRSGYSPRCSVIVPFGSSPLLLTVQLLTSLFLLIFFCPHPYSLNSRPLAHSRFSILLKSSLSLFSPSLSALKILSIVLAVRACEVGRWFSFPLN
jgi:hypothetical protein